jgi:hypothetical protein
VVEWTDERSVFTGECVFIVNPDPRSLWRNVEPPAEGPYFKASLDCRLLQTPSGRIAAASRRGRSHEHAGTFRDDDFFLDHVADAGWSVLLVADGAGSATSSREGARLAVETAGRHLSEAVAGDFGREMADALAAWPADPEAAQQALGTGFHYLFHAAAAASVQAIEAEAGRTDAPTKDYSTTLLAAVVRCIDGETFVASFWLGDGAIASYHPAACDPAGAVKLMGLPDSGEYAGQTRFLDRAALQDAGFGKRVRLGRYPAGAAVLLMTDGVSDPFFETDNGLADPARWKALWDALTPALAADRPELALLDWLQFFVPGHHDDRTIAVLW